MNGRTAVSECQIYSERSVWLYVCQKFVHRSFIFSFAMQRYDEIAYFPNIYKLFLLSGNYFPFYMVDNCLKVITLQLLIIKKVNI